MNGNYSANEFKYLVKQAKQILYPFFENLSTNQRAKAFRICFYAKIIKDV